MKSEAEHLMFEVRTASTKNEWNAAVEKLLEHLVDEYVRRA